MGKERREHMNMNNAHPNDMADPSCADDIVLNRAAEAKLLTAAAKNGVIKVMEAPIETDKYEKAAHTSATAPAKAALLSHGTSQTAQSDTCPASETPKMEDVENVETAAPEKLAPKTLKKTQCSARDSNGPTEASRFFQTIQPRLDGRAKPMPRLVAPNRCPVSSATSQTVY